MCSSDLTKWLVLFALLMLMTWPIALNQIEHERFTVTFLKYVMLYYLLVKTIDTPDKFNKMMWVFLTGQFYLGWLAYESGRSSGGRLESLGGADSQDANMAAALIVSCVPIVVNYLIIGKRWQKICALPMLVFILNALILINSRGAFLALIVAIAYYLFVSMKSPAFPKFNKTKVIATVVVGAAMFVYLTDTLFIERMGTITDPGEESGYTGRERIDYWLMTFDMVERYPFGTGVMGFQTLSPQYVPPEALSSRSGTRAVHSLYFQILAEYGYHGFILFGIFILSNFRYLWKLRKELIKKQHFLPYYMAIALEASFLSLLVAGIFISILYMEIIYWMAAFSASFGNIYFKIIKHTEEDNLPRQGRV